MYLAENRQNDIEDEEKMVVKISSGRYPPDLDLAEYYNSYKKEHELEFIPPVPHQNSENQYNIYKQGMDRTFKKNGRIII